MNNMKKKKGNTVLGFTLVELLVVIAIIAILAGILIPTVGRAKTKAKVATVRIQMKDIEAAIKSYKADYSRFPVPKNYPRNLVGDSSSGFIPSSTSALHSAANPNAMYNKLDIYNVAFPKRIINPTPPATPFPQNCYNSDIMFILMNDTSDIPGNPNKNGSRNPKKNKYLSPKDAGLDSEAARAMQAGVSSDKRIYRDPFGNRYKISMDLNGDGYCYDYYYAAKGPQEGLSDHTAPIHSDYIMNHRILGTLPAGQTVLYSAYKGDVMIWTAGPDRVIEGMGVPEEENPDVDNIKSWK